MDKKIREMRVEFITNIANQVEVLQYGGNVPQQGPVNSVNSLINELVEDEELDIRNPNNATKIRKKFQFLMSNIISGNGD